MKWNLIFWGLLILFGCQTGNQKVYDDLILLDANQDKDRVDLMITDIADVSYIPLKFGEENVLVGTSFGVGRNIFVSRNEIFLGDISQGSPKLVTYNFDGEPTRIFGSYGRGPGEYISMTGFVVDTLAREVIIYDTQLGKFIVYGMDGDFKREKNLEQTYQYFNLALENINDRYIVAYKEDSQIMSDEDILRGDRLYMGANELVTRGKLFMLFDKQTLEEVDFIDFEYEKPCRWMIFTLVTNLTTTKNGVYITSTRSDTTYFLDKNLTLTPRFVDITKYDDINHEARLFPAAESEQYIFFSTELEHDLDNQNKQRYFVYDKKTNKLSRINTGLSERGISSSYLELIKNNVVFNQHTTTLNHNYVAILIPPHYIFDKYNDLPVALKRTASQIQENDNPVLMLIKLK